jgi:hypothetical protein
MILFLILVSHIAYAFHKIYFKILFKPNKLFLFDIYFNLFVASVMLPLVPQASSTQAVLPSSTLAV